MTAPTATPPASPIASPIDIWSANSRTTSQNVACACVASSIIPSIRAIPTGSLAPDSPSRIVPVLPATSRSPSTENITAGSVGATAAPTRPLAIQPRPSAQWATSVAPPAVANVPTTPSATIEPPALRKRRQPIESPPSKRITISATDATRSTVRIEIASDGKRSEATAAATRNGAAAGTRRRSLSFVVRSAAASAPETTRIARPNAVSSCKATCERRAGRRRRRRRARSATPAPPSRGRGTWRARKAWAGPRRPAFPAHLPGRLAARSKTPYFSVTAVIPGPGIVSLPMWRLIPILLASLLCVPAALADRRAAGDGSLVVSGASARAITVRGSGLVFGHIQQGTLAVQSYDAADTYAPQISGASGRVVGNAVVYSGSDIRFLLPNGRFSIRIDGTGIDISAVGKGTVVAIGLGTADDGTLSVNSGAAQELGVLPTTARFSGSNVPAAGVASGGLAKQGTGTAPGLAKDKGR